MSRSWKKNSAVVVCGLIAAFWVTRASPQPAPRSVAELEAPKRRIARTAIARVGEAYRIRAEAGQPIRVEFLDGSQREARVRVVRGAFEAYRIPFQITDNECSPNRGMICHLSLPVRRHRLRLAWSAHPEPTRIGQTVRWSGQSQAVLDFTLPVTAGYREHYANLAENLPAESIQCEDDRWLPSALAEAPRVKIARWSTQTPSPLTHEESLYELSRDVDLNRISAGDRQVVHPDPENLPKKNVLGIIERVEFEIQSEAAPAAATCRVEGTVESASTDLGEIAGAEEDYLYQSDSAISETGLANLDQMLYEVSLGESAATRVPRDLE